MHADICDSSDDKAVERFRAALHTLGATLVQKDWAIGVDCYELEIGNQHVTVFIDEWSIDIEGPEDLVQHVLAEFKRAEMSPS